ncbi:hypothetical protein [Polaromonas sp. SM01]|uniref:hypothetical protein n=1 Tax=Polaromonas sp. SM01 TaxID=3085630 RepID=UPI002981CFCC|nr:hypothetical protein [Polaromonas sp. SM01]MDW5443275.1 hypothetical protein [Polaromonas sp. SM01]
MVFTASQAQNRGIARHLHLAAHDALAIAVNQLAQAFPVNRAGGLAASDVFCALALIIFAADSAGVLDETQQRRGGQYGCGGRGALRPGTQRNG